jgi:demethylmenaquinone methyltransferase/2-methoxy-6-polyprenyl-1,4-benzoquinol methylase
MTTTQKDIFIRNIFTITAPHLDFLTSLFSFGICHLWRRKAVSLSGIKAEDKILDICTGTGDMAVQLMGKIGPQGSLTGIDFCENMLELAREKVKKRMNGRPRNVSFALGDAKDIRFSDNSFDLATAGFGMRNIPDTTAALKEVKRVLKPGGRFVCLELTRPYNKWLLPFYSWYVCKVMPFISKFFIKTAAPYTYLPDSIETFYPPSEFIRVIRHCGFTNVQVHPMSLGIATIFTAVKS